MLKSLTPVRLLKNEFFNQILNLENSGGSKEQLSDLLGKGRAKKGMYEGDMEEGELEIGQISGLINDIIPAKEIVENIIEEFIQIKSSFLTDKRFGES